MKIQVNMTTSEDDMVRYSTREEILEQIDGFDGLELMYFGDDEKITPDMVTGLHFVCKQTWYDFWTGNEEGLIAEFDDLETAKLVYGGTLDPHALVEHYQGQLELAHKYGAEYVVYHISESTAPESMVFEYKHSSEQIIDACCDIMNEVFAGEDGSIALMMENLWYPGLTFTDPKMTKHLLDGIEYPNKGIMLDTGHLLHTDFDIASQEEGVAYINRMIDEHEAAGLLPFVRGMHLQQSITGELCKQLRQNPPGQTGTYFERSAEIFSTIFSIDKHLPFTCAGVREMIDRLPLEYLTFEFITDDEVQHTGYLKAQREAIGLP